MLTRRNLLLSLGAACTCAAQETRIDKIVFVGDARVRVLVLDVKPNGHATFVYFHPHENEHASALVARHTIRELGGRLVEIRSEGDRLITFRLKGSTYSFDPNRMFTDAGLKRSLSHYGPFSEAAMDSARGLRNAVLNQFDKGKKPIIALHNNAEDGVNALYYKKGGQFAAQASKVAINPKEQPHNFFMVLDDGLFGRLHHAGFNTVLQSPDPPDDGSLAIFCQQHHWAYVNVEASEGDINQQQRMLDALPAAIA
jgi:hypothetical protein